MGEERSGPGMCPGGPHSDDLGNVPAARSAGAEGSVLTKTRAGQGGRVGARLPVGPLGLN